MTTTTSPSKQSSDMPWIVCILLHTLFPQLNYSLVPFLPPRWVDRFRGGFCSDCESLFDAFISRGQEQELKCDRMTLDRVDLVFR